MRIRQYRNWPDVICQKSDSTLKIANCNKLQETGDKSSKTHLHDLPDIYEFLYNIKYVVSHDKEIAQNAAVYLAHFCLWDRLILHFMRKDYHCIS